MGILTLVIAGAAVYVIFRILRALDEKQAAKDAQQLKEAEERRLSSEHVAKVQAKFEAQLDQALEIKLPDAIRGRRAFVYWQLMRKWFGLLAAQSRYDEPKARKIRQDWLSYMDLLDDEARAKFLSCEGKEDKRSEYDRNAHAAALEIAAIEEAFAAAIGPEAVNELGRVKSASYDAFDNTGKRPIAALGYRYNSFSQELEPKKVASTAS